MTRSRRWVDRGRDHDWDLRGFMIADVHRADALDGELEWTDHRGVYHTERARILAVIESRTRHHRGQRRLGRILRQQREHDLDENIRRYIRGMRLEFDVEVFRLS